MRFRHQLRVAPAPGSALLVAFALVLAVVLGGCGSKGGSGSRLADVSAANTASSTDCVHTVLQAFTQVASRIYNQSARGRTIVSATHRIEHSRALSSAVEHGDRDAVHRVLAGLIKSQIVRIHIRHGSHTLASYGTRNALAPVSGKLRNAAGRVVGSFALSVQGQEGYRQTVAGLTGAKVSVQPTVRARTGSSAGSGTSLTSSFTERAFPSGKLRISLRLDSPPQAAICGLTTAQTTANAFGTVGERIYAEERAGPRVVAVARYVARYAPLLQAVAAANAIATRAAIDGLFKTHLHIVRVRATRANQLVADVGGPYALAPVSVPLRDAAGHTFGAVQLSLQDDVGYMTLAHRFTGAQVLMRVGAHQVMGTLQPGPRGIPRSGPVVDGNTSYQAFSFTGEAFPVGALRISLLTPSD